MFIRRCLHRCGNKINFAQIILVLNLSVLDFSDFDKKKCVYSFRWSTFRFNTGNGSCSRKGMLNFDAIFRYNAIFDSDNYFWNIKYKFKKFYRWYFAYRTSSPATGNPAWKNWKFLIYTYLKMIPKPHRPFNIFAGSRLR